MICPKCNGTGTVTDSVARTSKTAKFRKGAEQYSQRRHLSTRAYNCLRNEIYGYEYSWGRVETRERPKDVTRDVVRAHLEKVGTDAMLRIPNLGHATLGEIMAWLDDDYEPPKPLFWGFDRCKSIYERHKAGESTHAIAKDLNIGMQRVYELRRKYIRWLEKQ